MIMDTMTVSKLSSSINDTDSCILWNNTSAVAESLAVMMQKERTVYKRRDYLSNRTTGLQGNITEEDRTSMVDWCYRVVDVCQLDRETVAMAMDMVDRFLSNKSSVAATVMMGNRIQFQLLTLTALYVSIKISNKSVLGSDFFSVASCELYSVEDIEAMEHLLLKELSWCISAPTCVQMAHHILKLTGTHVMLDKATWANILDEVDYQAEHAVRHNYFVTQLPSTVAVAAIFNALDRFNKFESQEFIRAVLSVIKTAAFESLEVILATRNKLHSLVNGDTNTADGFDDIESTDSDQGHHN